MSVFDDLLSIKRFREHQAEVALAGQRQRYLLAQQNETAARERLQQFKEWAQQQECRLYRELCSRVVQVRDIENVLQEVAGLRAGEQDHEEALTQARQQVETESQSLTRHREHQQASRSTEKFVELAARHLDEHLQILEQKEDLELEEAALQMRDREEWGAFEEDEELAPL